MGEPASQDGRRAAEGGSGRRPAAGLRGECHQGGRPSVSIPLFLVSMDLPEIGPDLISVMETYNSPFKFWCTI